MFDSPRPPAQNPPTEGPFDGSQILRTPDTEVAGGMPTASDAPGAGGSTAAPEALDTELSLTAFRAFFRAAPDGILVVDADGRIRELNAAAERMFGWTRDELLGRVVEELVPVDRREAHAASRVQFTRHAEQRPMGIGLELSARRKDGSTFPVEIGLSPVETSEGSFVLAAVRNMIAWKRMREFGAGVLRGAEEERQRIARDLHDDTAQRLASLLLRVQMARRSDDPARREELLAEMREEILHASEGVRRILRGLRPPALEEAGVVAAVRAHVRGALAEEEIAVDLDAEEVEPALDSEAKLALYRIIQEAISNAVRHAEAARLRIRIESLPGLVRAVVTDDGRGFEPRDREREEEGGRGLGILGMKERASLVGGRVRIETAPGQGTRVEVEIPVSD